MFMTSMAMIEGLQLRLCVGVANVVVANLLSWALECTIVYLLVLHNKKLVHYWLYVFSGGH